MSCFSSFSLVEDMRDSTTMPQIVKIVRMIVKFHPLLTLTSLIFRVIFLQTWIEEEVGNQWKVFKEYCQSRMRGLLDLITEKMRNLSKALQMHLNNKATKGQLKVKLIGKLALFFATFLMLDTEFSSKYDKSGAKTQLLFSIGLELLIYSKLWSQFGIFWGRCEWASNSTSNFVSFILALVFAKCYDDSLRSLSIVLCIIVFFLCLLVVLRPRIDLGLFSFIIGVIGSITYNCFKFTFPTWIIASICFVLLCFKSWLDEYWLDLKEDQSSTNTTDGSTSMFFILSSTTIHIVGAIFVYSVIKSSSPYYKVWLSMAINSMIWNVRFHNFYLKYTSLPSTNDIRINSLILIVVSVAQGMFVFALITWPVADYKDMLFIVISYVIFCIWLRNFFSKDLSPPSTNTKGIRNMILYLQSVATYGIVVLAGLEPCLYHREWLVVVTCFVLCWVQLRTSIPKDLLLSITVEFKALQWWATVVYSTVSEVISGRIYLSTTRN